MLMPALIETGDQLGDVFCSPEKHQTKNLDTEISYLRLDILEDVENTSQTSLSESREGIREKMESI
eukprot:3258818-Pleurochrysis_carterae.AAC.1